MKPKLIWRLRHPLRWRHVQRDVRAVREFADVLVNDTDSDIWVNFEPPTDGTEVDRRSSDP